MEDGPEPAEAHHDQYDARHNRRDRKPGHPVLPDDSGDDDDEGPRGSPDEEARPSEDRNQEAGHDCRDKSLLRGHAAGDSECDCEREGDDAHDDSRDEIRDEPLPAVPSLLKQMEEFRTEYPCVFHQIPNTKNAARSRTTLNTTIIPFLFRRKDTTSVSHSEIFRRKSAWKICTSFNVKGFGGVGTAFKFRFEKVEVVLVDFLEGAEEFVGGHLLNLFLDFWREGREQVVAGAELDEIH